MDCGCVSPKRVRRVLVGCASLSRGVRAGGDVRARVSDGVFMRGKATPTLDGVAFSARRRVLEREIARGVTLRCDVTLW